MGCVVLSLAVITTIATSTLVQADAWYCQLLRSHEMMQQLVGGADPSSPLDADWDTASVTSTEQTDQTDDKPSGWAAGQGLPNTCPSHCRLSLAGHASPTMAQATLQLAYHGAHMLFSPCQPGEEPLHC